MTTAQILTHPPISGSVVEVRFDAEGDCTWIQFDNEGDTWSGIFGRGPTSVSRVAVEGDFGFVISGGRGYFINLETRSMIYHSAEEHLDCVMPIPNTDKFVAASTWKMYVFASTTPEPMWEDDVAFDGIKLISVTPTVITAEVADYDGWHQFKLEIGTWKELAGLGIRRVQ